MQRKTAAAVTDSVGRQIFSEISHPAAETETDKVVPDDVFIPFKGCRICQIHNTAVIFPKIKEIITAIFPADKIAFFLRLPKEHSAFHQIRVDIAHPGGFSVFRNDLIQLRIKLLIPAPVPLQAGTKRSDTFSFPVLDPDGGKIEPGIPAALFHGNGTLRAALHTEPQATHSPCRQRRLAAEKRCQFFQQGRVVFRTAKHHTDIRAPQGNLVITAFPQIQFAVFIVFHMGEIHPRGYHCGLREEGGVIVPTASVSSIGKAGNLCLFIAADTLLSRPDRPKTTAEIKCGKLLPAAGYMFFLISRQTDPEAVETAVAAASAETEIGAVFSQAETVFACHSGMGKAELLFISGFFTAGKVQREAFRETIFNIKVATEHPYFFFPDTQKHGGVFWCVPEKKSIIGKKGNTAGRVGNQVKHKSDSCLFIIPAVVTTVRLCHLPENGLNMQAHQHTERPREQRDENGEQPADQDQSDQLRSQQQRDADVAQSQKNGKSECTANRVFKAGEKSKQPGKQQRHRQKEKTADVKEQVSFPNAHAGKGIGIADSYRNVKQV